MFYVDDILEIVNKDCVEKLTDHNDKVDISGSIKFTYEKESEGKLPFLDTLIVKKEDGSVKRLVYRKPTHTDQYLNYESHYPLHHTPGVIRTSYDRKNDIVTEEADKRKEEKKVQKALETSGYPKCTFVKSEKSDEAGKIKESYKGKG